MLGSGLGLGKRHARKKGIPEAILSSSPISYISPATSSTLFQDETGATAAGAGDPIGMALDKSLKAHRGGDMWVISDVIAGAVWTEHNGIYRKDSTGFATLGLTTLTSNTWYEFQITVAPEEGVLNLWRRDALDSKNEQAVSGIGAGRHRFIAKTGPAPNGEGHLLWLDGNAFIGTMSEASVRPLFGDHFTAPSDAARPINGIGNTPHIVSDGVSDTLRADLPVTGVITLWASGDFTSLAGGDRLLSIGGDSGADWNRAGYFSIEANSGGYLTIVQDGVGAMVTSGFPPYILVEIDTDGHRSYGPLGVNSTVATPATAADRVALFASANSAPTAYGAVKLTSFGIVNRRLSIVERDQMLNYLAAVPAP